MISRQRVYQAFQELYGRTPRMFHAPGRVNLIGEHTDYNQGFVLPMALSLGTLVGGAVRDDRRVRVRSLNRGETAELNLDAPAAARRGLWVDYVEGVIRTLERGGHRLAGADLLLESDVPSGAGLSSSAALEVSVGFAMLTLSGLEVNRTALAQAGQSAEHEYVGTRCGIMDQFISAHGKAGNALLLDCRDLHARDIPLRLGSAELLICDTRVKHNLASSEYNARRTQCDQAVAALSKVKSGLTALREVSPEELDAYAELLPEPLLRRARHVVTENARTVAVAEALIAGDLEAVGDWMIASHRSLRRDYEVSCVELDQVVDAAVANAGVHGARMTGGGFGGCAVLLVESNAVESVKQAITGALAKPPLFYPALSGDGVTEL